MTFRTGSDSLKYELVEGWEQLPAGWSHPDVAAVATDSRGQVYVFGRGEHPVIVYDREGHFLGSWGEGQFPHPHGIYIDPQDQLYLVDDGDHTARKYTTDGKLLMTVGKAGVASNTGYTGDTDSVAHAAGPFNRPTNMVASPGGPLFASDGYGNARVHRFSLSGELQHSWGEPGTGDGQFKLPHGLWIHADGRVFVADRENDRIQIFGPDGSFLSVWSGFHRPSDIFMDAAGLIYVAELAIRPKLEGWERWKAEKPARLSIFDSACNPLHSWGEADGAAPGNFVAPHDLWVDNQGAIYVAEVTYTGGIRHGYVPSGTHALQKFARV